MVIYSKLSESKQVCYTTSVQIYELWFGFSFDPIMTNLIFLGKMFNPKPSIYLVRCKMVNFLKNL